MEFAFENDQNKGTTNLSMKKTRCFVNRKKLFQHFLMHMHMHTSAILRLIIKSTYFCLMHNNAHVFGDV